MIVRFANDRCDAEPEALATYVLALLKHDAPEHELRKEVTRQLDEFFEDGVFLLLFSFLFTTLLYSIGVGVAFLRT